MTKKDEQEKVPSSFMEEYIISLHLLPEVVSFLLRLCHSRTTHLKEPQGEATGHFGSHLTTKGKREIDVRTKKCH